MTAMNAARICKQICICTHMHICICIYTRNLICISVYLNMFFIFPQVKLETRIPAAFMSGVAAVVPQISGMDLQVRTLSRLAVNDRF